MSRKSITERLKITGRGKVLRRAMALGHSRGNKSMKQMRRKKGKRGIVINTKRLN